MTTPRLSEKATLLLVRKAFVAAVAADPLLAKLKLRIGNMTFSHNNFSGKITGVFEGGLSKDEERYNDAMCMSPSMLSLGDTMINGGVVKGMTARGKVIFERGGKLYTTSATHARKVAP